MRGGWAAALFAFLLAGCAALKEKDAPAPQAAPTSLEVTGGSPALQQLLERFLDVARVGALAGSETIDDLEWSRMIQAAPAQARELLQTEGYFSPRIEVADETRPGAAQRRVRLNLDPGPRAEISRVTFEVEGPLDSAAEAGDARARATLDDLRKSWTLPAGKPFRNADWGEAKAAALARLRAAGYASASWAGTGAEVEAATNQVRLFVVADSGPLFRFGELQVEGLATHDLQTVRDLAAMEPGTPLGESVLLDYQERLQKAGLFDNVSVTLDPDPAQAAAAKVIVRLREAPLQTLTFGIGYSGTTGQRVSVDHTYRRVFGYPLAARNKLLLGRLSQSWDGELSTPPGKGLWRTLLGGTIERLVSSDIVLTQQLRFGRAQEGQRIDRTYFVQSERSLRSVDQIDTEVVALSLNYQGIWRHLDNAVLPTQGYSLSAQGSFGRAHGTGAETGLFVRSYGRLTGYLPLGRNWYGQARVELGQVFKKNTVAVPDPELFRAGGEDSVRGYGYRDLGPIVGGAVAGGNSLFTTSIELAHPLSASIPTLWGAVFADAGNAANSFREMKIDRGAGVGLRWRSPVGPLRLDLAYGYQVRKYRFYFSVGVTF
ncbi:MAG: BamA/TamA family outer membrane protein [Burkholderiales bacterium]|nr:BamA/TamA family outer membrane protein [Burkholderiales bacterium]